MKSAIASWVALVFAGVAVTNVAVAETRDVADFRIVSYALPFDVELVAANSPYVQLEGDQDTIDEVITEVDGDTLHIRKDDRWFDWSDGEVLVTVGYTELSALHMNGSGDAYAQEIHADDLHIKISGSAGVEVDRLVSNDVSIAISGSGNVNLNDLEADFMRTDIAGSGDVEVSGSVVSQKISIAGSGDYQARDLRTQEADVDIKGSGDVAVWALASLAVRIMGSGDIEYYGEPQLSKRILGSGNIKHRGPAP
jgi:hypothetical protein